MFAGACRSQARLAADLADVECIFSCAASGGSEDRGAGAAEEEARCFGRFFFNAGCDGKVAEDAGRLAKKAMIPAPRLLMVCVGPEA